MKYSARTYSHREIDKEKWDNFTKNSPQSSLFVQSEYLSIVGSDWQAVIVSDEKAWQAVMPFVIHTKRGYRFCIQPVLSQYWGILHKPVYTLNTYEKYSFIRSVTEAIVEALPVVDYHQYYFSPEWDYALPFYWKGFSIYLRYSYHLALDTNTETLWRNLASPLQRQIRKAQKNGLVAEASEEIQTLIRLFNLNVSAGKDIIGTQDKIGVLKKLEQIAKMLLQSGKGRLYLVRNEEHKVLSAGLFAFFQKKCIYLAGAFLPDYGDSGAMSLMMWTAVDNAGKEGYTLLDFEGSMIAGVEAFFRKFGGFPVSYPEIVKNNLPFYIKWIIKLKS